MLLPVGNMKNLLLRCSLDIMTKQQLMFFKENENIEVVTIDERIKELSKNMKKISINEKIQPAVERSEKNVLVEL